MGTGNKKKLHQNGLVCCARWSKDLANANASEPADLPHPLAITTFCENSTAMHGKSNIIMPPALMSATACPKVALSQESGGIAYCCVALIWTSMQKSDTARNE